MVNLLSFFRVSLFADIIGLTLGAGALNHAIDLLTRVFLEFKSFELFSLTFGMGVAVQTERARERGVLPECFLARRFFFLLIIGVAHLILVSNVDILTLYAVCGFCLILCLRLPVWALTLLGVAAIYLPTPFPFGPVLPSGAVLVEHAVDATRTYSSSGFIPLIAYRWTETRDFIAPLLESVAQKALGLMLLGMALWRGRVLRESDRFRPYLWTFCVLAITVGLMNTLTSLFRYRVPHAFALLGSNIPMALGYAAAWLAWNRSPAAARLLSPLAAAGQMALTNYLTQTIVFSFVFNGWGLGLMGRLSETQAALFGIALYAAQLWFSVWWLARFRFGPFEWLWRSATYARRQPFAVAGSTA